MPSAWMCSASSGFWMSVRKLPMSPLILFRVPFKPPAHLLAAFSARRAVNEGKPRLPQSG